MSDGNHLTGNTNDAAGNVTYDSSSGLSYQWNHLNLIKNISETGATLVNYSYLADGTKLSPTDIGSTARRSRRESSECRLWTTLKAVLK